MRIDPNPVAVASAALVATSSATPVEEGKVAPSARELGHGIKVTLSEQAQARPAESNQTDAAQESDLPDHIKNLLKHIREIKAQIAEKQAELAALQRAATDPQQVKQLQQRLTSLSSSLTSAYVSLAQALDDGTLSDEQKVAVLNMSMG